jgi:hypothetical protein
LADITYVSLVLIIAILLSYASPIICSHTLVAHGSIHRVVALLVFLEKRVKGHFRPKLNSIQYANI